ncbi:MAG: hypothetical protein RJA10_4610 [Pseudomonadota bacterium]
MSLGPPAPLKCAPARADNDGIPTPAPDAAMSTASPPDAASADLSRGRVMARALGTLLDQARGSREVLPHLAALERALAEHGCNAVDRIPPASLGRICSQLSSLPLPEQEPALHDLLGRLLDAQEQLRMEWSPDGAFHPDKTVVIREATHSEFMAATQEQAETMPMPLR